MKKDFVVCFLLQFICSSLGFKDIIENNKMCPLEKGTEATCKDKKVFEDSECPLSICGKNETMCRQYHTIDNMLNCEYHKKTVSYLTVRNVTELSMTRNSIEINYNDKPTSYNHRRNCSGNSAFFDIVRNSNQPNESSFSPWEYMKNVDENRFPREILETKCHCLNCLNQHRNDTYNDYESVPLLVTRYFQMKQNGSTVFNAQFSYGCICRLNPITRRKSNSPK